MYGVSLLIPLFLPDSERLRTKEEETKEGRRRRRKAMAATSISLIGFYPSSSSSPFGKGEKGRRGGKRPIKLLLHGFFSRKHGIEPGKIV